MDVDRRKGKCLTTRVSSAPPKFDDLDSQKKSHQREPPNFPERMNKYSTVDQIPKPHKHHAPLSKSPTKHSNFMPNDDLYRIVRSGAGGRTSMENFTVTRGNKSRRQRHAVNVLSPIRDEDEDLSEPEYRGSRAKDYEDEEADDEIEYDDDDHQIDRRAQKLYKTVNQQSSCSDTPNQRYKNWLSQRVPRSHREIEKFSQPKYERLRRGKQRSDAAEESAEEHERVVVGVHRCSECGKTSETVIKPSALRNTRVYDDHEYQENFTVHRAKFEDPNDVTNRFNPRRSKISGEQRKQNRQISKINYYE